MTQKIKEISSNQFKLYSDILLFVAFVLTNIPQTTGILIIAALVVAFASIPLQNTEWADGIRAGFETGETGDAGSPDIGVAIYFLPLVKVSLFMGIGAFFTWLARRIIRFGSHLLSSDQKAATRFTINGKGNLR